LQELTEPELSVDEVLQNLTYWLEHSDSNVTWPFVKRGLRSLIDDLKLTLGSRSDRPMVENDIIKIQEFIEGQEDVRSRRKIS
jgi:hypothetical protein